MKWLKKLGRAAWDWFMGLSLRGKGIVVGVIAVIALIGSLTSEPVDETEPTQQAASEPATEQTVNAASPAPTGPVECEPTDDGIVLTAECFGPEWPLTVDSATLTCVPPTSVLLRVEDGPDSGIYPVNGSATTHHDYAQELENIWREDPDVPDARISIGPVIERGLPLCEELRGVNERLLLRLARDFDESGRLDNFPEDQVIGYGIGWCHVMDMEGDLDAAEEYLARHRLRDPQVAASVIVAAVNSVCERHKEAIEEAS